MPRQQIPIDGDQVEKLASYGCTQDDIADFFGCSRATIASRFQREFELGKATVRVNVRRWQIRRARKGSDTMLIHLGKQYCGQADKVETKNEVEATVIEIPRKDDADDQGSGGAAIEVPE